jgi:hypothetical protein
LALACNNIRALLWAWSPGRPTASKEGRIEPQPFTTSVGRTANYYATASDTYIPGSFKLYHFTTRCTKYRERCPTYRTSVSPNHAGKPIYFRVQKYYSGAWHAVRYFSRSLNSTSSRKVAFAYSSQSIRNVPFRVRAEFKGDADHLANMASWSYYKVTR